jgi:glycyl-tRNA synthetase (class II)
MGTVSSRSNDLEEAKWERLLISIHKENLLSLSSVFYGGPVNRWDYRPGGADLKRTILSNLVGQNGKCIKKPEGKRRNG